MAPSGRQRTFEIVPNAPILGQQHPGDNVQPVYSKPPMTTKQAKKLHNQKNKGPKLSKAEQRRIELMEQDRIRKEFEKEKAQARARTAREKKKAKEDKEKEERKRKGLPLVDIHPSQDTISRFISRMGSVIGVKRDPAAVNTLDSVREDPEIATDAGESVTDAGDEAEYESDKENQEPVGDPESERQAKRRRLSPSEEKSAGRRSLVASQLRADPVAKIAEQLEVESYSRATSVDTDDAINQTLLEEQIFADVEQASSRTDRDTNEKCPSVAVVEHPPEPVSQPAVPTVPVSSTPKEPAEPPPLPTRLQAPQRSTTPVRRDLQPGFRAASNILPHLGNETFKKPSSPYVPAPRSRPAHTSTAFQIPNGPPKFKSPAVRSNVSAERPRFLPKHLNTAQRRQLPAAHHTPGPVATHTLPTSTQAFLLDHADELFPSPTQEARELCEDSVTEAPKAKVNTPKLSIDGAIFRSEIAINQISAAAPQPRPGSRLPTLAALAPAAEDFFDSSFISTQDFMISTQDILDIDTPSKARPVSAAPVLPIVKARPLAPALPAAGIEKNSETVSTVPKTLQNRFGQPPSGANGDKAGTDPNGAVPCCLNRIPSGSRPSQGHKSSCAAMRKRSSSQATQREQSDQTIAASRPVRSSYQRHNAAAKQSSTPNTEDNNDIADQAPEPITTPDKPRPKKRMFGSSGPGPEGLVAMERSYQEMRRQERAREAQNRAQERLMKAPASPAQQVDLDIAGFADELLADDLSGGRPENGPCRRVSDVVQQGPGDPPLSNGKRPTTLAASQETDYGDIDGDEFDFLEGDTSWLDEGLDDI
ncbi:hypothetical protein N0V82_009352 [Gnomoniopsis sp. IMI 355080]|nr:hypothetical protein N0V82_009352 [Gnomoniopsis sp. IMI 355080]